MKRSSIISKLTLPGLIIVAFLLMALWLLAGRLVFGVFGWMVLVLLLTAVPVVVIYGVVLGIIAGIRQRTYEFRRNGPFIGSVLATLGALFVAGLFMPDGGDSKDSAASALSVVLMDRTNSELIGVSGTIAGIALMVAFVTAIVAFVFVFAERPKRARATTSETTLKQNK